MSIVHKLTEAGLISPPEVVLKSGLYEVLMGSHAFGTALPESDCDVYGFLIPPPGAGGNTVEEYRVLNLEAEIAFYPGREKKRRQYDVVLYSLPVFFQRCLAGKSQSLETLFASEENVITMSEGARLVRNSWQLFLNRGTVTEFRRFAKAQLDGMVSRQFAEARKETIERFGYDVKAAYHSLRLLLEARQLLQEGTLDLRRNKKLLIAIRQGQWKEEDVVAYFATLDAELTGLYAGSKLPEFADQEKLSQLLADCLERG